MLKSGVNEEKKFENIESECQVRITPATVPCNQYDLFPLADGAR